MSTPSENLRTALALLETDGWVKGALYREPQDDRPRTTNWRTPSGETTWGYCSLGAVTEALHPGQGLYGYAYSQDPDELAYLAKAIGETGFVVDAATAAPHVLPQIDTVTKFNDRPASTFEDIRRVFERAMELAGTVSVDEIRGAA